MGGCGGSGGVVGEERKKMECERDGDGRESWLAGWRAVGVGVECLATWEGATERRSLQQDCDWLAALIGLPA